LNIREVVRAVIARVTIGKGEDKALKLILMFMIVSSLFTKARFRPMIEAGFAEGTPYISKIRVLRCMMALSLTCLQN
jgi:hypothetical protein